jgi:type VI protein secretion system component VasF
MKESGEEAAERLAIFYICIGLGFTGIYFKQPEVFAQNDAEHRAAHSAFGGE